MKIIRIKVFLRKLFAGVGFALLLGLFALSAARAQKQDSRWAGPFRLSSETGFVISSGGVQVADQYGFVHAFWAEQQENRYIIQYARFDGEIWSVPTDIFISSPEATFGQFSAPVVDPSGFLYLQYTLHNRGPIFLMRAPVSDAISASSWEQLPPLEEPALRSSMQVDQEGVLHLVYASNFQDEEGVFYTRSLDQGFSWEVPLRIDPDLPVNLRPVVIEFEIDPQTGFFHTVWKYDEYFPDGTMEGRMIRYANSFDGGTTWAVPVTFDTADETNDELRAGGPSLAVSNETVVVVWPGTGSTHREHVFSLDSGRSWVGPVRNFGDLHGSAGDSLAVDGAGRFHFFGQVRWPQAVYDIVWDQGGWSIPGMIYLLREDASEEIGDRIHVHSIEASVRRGNQLVLIFTDSPTDTNRYLYAMHRTVEEIPQEPILPTPPPVPTATPVPTDTPVPVVDTPEATAVPFDTSPPATNAQPNLGLWVGIISAVLVIGGVLVFNFMRNRRY
jgi:hypothetical protein